MRCHGLKVPDHSLIDTNRGSFILFPCMLTILIYVRLCGLQNCPLGESIAMNVMVFFTSVCLSLLKHKFIFCQFCLAA